MNTKFLTQAEIKSLFDVIAPPRDKAIFLIAYRHGLRASEVGLIRKSDVDLTGATLLFRRLKKSSGGVHPMQTDEVETVRAYLDQRAYFSPLLFPSARGEGISRFQLHRLMRVYGDLAGFPRDKQHFHILKHSIAVHMIDAGADILFVQDWLGHRDVRNTLIYRQLTSRRRMELFNQLFGSGRII
ncbi:MAG: tyrosine-type recombinase/integrase [Nitrospira sp.]|nr:tyrosine-type recombinase/integrase [Nitrospira sp.]